jgi:uroporphyrinogen-III decarboxylase
MDISSRKRFKDIAHFVRPGDLCIASWFNGFWDETIPGWIKSGAPPQLKNNTFCGKYFDYFYVRVLGEIISGLTIIPNDIAGYKFTSVIPPIRPEFDTQFISEDEHTFTIINRGGQTARYSKEHPQRMPEYLAQPVKDWDSWKKYKKSLAPEAPGRFPADWEAYARKMNAKDDPIHLHVGGFFSFLREWMGLEKLLYTFYDEPKLIEDMMETMLQLELAVIVRTVKDIKVDWVSYHEDMCYKSGPLISPQMFRKFMMPRYQKLTELLHKNNIDIIFVDCDGKIDKLLPLWLECGVNGMWPLEVTAGMDAVALRKEYGKDVILAGNIDKRALIKGKEAIKEEVLAKVPYLLNQGGYFPSVDHGVPPDVTLENYQYFINTLREVAGIEKIRF